MNLGLQETFVVVFSTLLLLSAIATGVGEWLNSHTFDALRLARLRIVNSRIRASWSVTALFAIAFTFGDAALLVVFAFASFFALREFVSLTPIKPSDHWALVFAFYGVIPIQYVLIGLHQYALYSAFIPVYVFLIMPIIMAIKQDTERYLERAAKVQWGMMISVYCISHAPAISTLGIKGYEGRGPLLLLYFLLVLLLGDLLQVVATAALGGKTLVSTPNKTREGLLAGGAAAVLFGTALWWMTPFEWWQSMLMSAAIMFAGFTGSVVLTAVKKSLGARIWDTEVVLTRGVLDRLDAMSFAAPVFFQLTLYFFVAGPAITG
jgi:phosphatidate cytidylyltransferase